MARPFSIQVLLTITLITSGTVSGSADHDKQQAQLDATCEQAREQRLAPERERFIQECVAEKQKPCLLYTSDAADDDRIV